MNRLDLTPFGFTPTESLVYGTLLTGGPGTGYAVARAAGLARANAYSALEGLVSKGAARSEGGRPKRYRPESPTALLARISNDHGVALERLTTDLEAVSLPSSPTLVEIGTVRAALHLIGHDVARAELSVALLAPAEAFPLLAPSLRRPAAAGLSLELLSVRPADLPFAEVRQVAAEHAWPGTPLLAIVDGRSAVVAARSGSEVQGHWSTAPTFVASARLAFERFRDGA
jgi:sugar-specific transcriptional regulator TrmB